MIIDKIQEPLEVKKCCNRDEINFTSLLNSVLKLCVV